MNALATARITKLEHHHDGHHVANLTVSGDTIPVHDRYGSWQTDVGAGATREVMPEFAALLTQRVRTEQRRARR